ncbi:MAG: NAD(P)-binding domain-containing protein [Candidatus Hydrogenedentes bacterium]|nr:NAD(P)-binding domain-containing protein [Candidatus Hydrogenedentota bacterium]
MATTDAQKAPRKIIATVPPQEILPIVDGNFESNVKGIYVIGDVTGLPLVKVAANHGVALLDKMEKQGRFAASQGREGLDLVIIGAGPAGLSAALEAQARGLRFVVLERTKAASTVRAFPPGKKVYAEPRYLKNSSGLETEGDLERDDFVARVDALVAEKALPIKEGTEVARVVKRGEGAFDVVTANDKTFQTANVVVAVGRQGQPRLLDVPGAEFSQKVTYRLHTDEDYHDKDVLIVGGGNSAIEAALMLAEHNRVTLSYRGDTFFRAKAENRAALEAVEQEGRIAVLRKSEVTEIRESEVLLRVDGATQSVPNDNVIILIGTLPPVDFLLDMGLELDGVWTAKRFIYSGLGIAAGIFVYFYAQYFSLHPDKAGAGQWYLPWASGLAGGPVLPAIHLLAGYALPVAWLLLLGLVLMNKNLGARGRSPLIRVPAAGGLLALGALVYGVYSVAPSIFTVDEAQSGPGPYFIPGFSWLYAVVPTYFGNLYGFYYLLYFTGITGFGLYWAWRANHRRIWIRNLTIIATQWTLWWGIPTFLVVFIGRNPWTPLIGRSLNAWPLKMNAFEVEAAGPGDPAWWHTVAVVGVVWAVVLTFIVIPLFTIKWGKIYCSYICSCGALAETVGNSYRHRGPKGDWPRRLERFGFVFILLAAVGTIAHLLGYSLPYNLYNVWVGTFLSGAIAVGLYPFLGQRVWCRMWCPLAFWMNFWGRWSKFKISPEKGKCIDCNVCNQYCQMGIDIKSRALQGIPVTLKDTPCVGCAECVVRCPMEILHIGEAPERV